MIKSAKFKSDPAVLMWRRQLKKAKTTRDVIALVRRMNPPVNCSHEAYIVCLALASIDYTELLKKEEQADECL
jgi:hypothetical protein